MAKSNGAGTIYQRGKIWWAQVWVDGKQISQSSKSTDKADAKKLRDKLLGKRHRGELIETTRDKILIGELLDDVLKSDIKESTRYVWKLVIEKSIRPAFGKIKAQRLSTAMMEEYREKRKAEGVTDATANRELSIMRTAFHNGRKRTPPKVSVVPYFPMVKETTVRQGFVGDDEYVRFLAALPRELKALFVCDYITGIRRSELLAITWPQLDFGARWISLEKGSTKTDNARGVPMLDDMYNLLWEAYQERQEKWPDSPWVFNREGVQIKDFRGSWKNACKEANLPDLHLHDLRRTAVRNMRRAGVPQVIRMRISGHKTDSMERRYNIVDKEDIGNARELMETWMSRMKKGAA
jgi:integrase